MKLAIVSALALAVLAVFFVILSLESPVPIRQSPPSAIEQKAYHAPAISPADTPSATRSPVVVTPAASHGSNAPVPAQEPEDYVQARIEKLNELEARYDQESLQAILGELTNSNREIRAAAVESTIQFQSRDAIPVLKNLATRTRDSEEKKALLDAAEFLALPTFTEIRSQNAGLNIIEQQSPEPAPAVLRPTDPE
jgi:hypothetical protein